MPVKINKTKLVFVWIGEPLPDWAIISIKIANAYCGLSVVLLLGKKIEKVLDPGIEIIYLEEFYRPPIIISKKYQNFKNNDIDTFWIKTTERFIVLHQYMKTYNVQNIFHAELDNIIFDISKLGKQLDAIGRGFFCPRDSAERGIASLAYINDQDSIEDITNQFLDDVGLRKNDMQILGRLLSENSSFFSLPVLPPPLENSWNSVGVDICKGVFDAASYGQYLLGTDPRAKRKPLLNGYINENMNLDDKRLFFKYDNESLKLSIKYCEGDYYNLYNLHVHSKLIGLFADKIKFINIINNINNKQKTLLSFNLKNIFRIPKKIKRVFK